MRLPTPSEQLLIELLQDPNTAFYTEHIGLCETCPPSACDCGHYEDPGDQGPTLSLDAFTTWLWRGAATSLRVGEWQWLDPLYGCSDLNLRAPLYYEGIWWGKVWLQLPETPSALATLEHEAYLRALFS